MSVLDLVREDLRSFGGYSSARTEKLQGEVWLNANESAWANGADAEGACRRYPDPQPAALREALAALYGVNAEQLLIGRGSDEAIDLLVRATCMPGQGGVVTLPPVFGMYAVSARLQGARVLEIPLLDRETGFVPRLSELVEPVIGEKARLVFLCSPANPTGGAVALEDLDAQAKCLRGRALLVVDEAYGEFSDVPSATTLLGDNDNLVVLRTLSKAHALAAARIGVAIGDPALIDVLRRCQAPYPVPTPCAELALAGLSAGALAATRERIAIVKVERERMRSALATLPCVRRVYPSDANFLLLRFHDAEAAFRALLAAGVVVRDQRAARQLGDALRITIGTPAQNDSVLSVLSALGPITAGAA
ncbi:MAG: histidinol-phosphate transaminase [Pseudoxanthomonas sp.]